MNVPISTLDVGPTTARYWVSWRSKFRATSGLFFACLATMAVVADNPFGFDVQRVPPEGGKHLGSSSDLQNMISEINANIERIRQQQHTDQLVGDQLERARADAFKQWAADHHADLGAGPKFSEIKNMELPSNLGGNVDIDWLATLGNQGWKAQGPLGVLTYLAGKEFWFASRSEQPDRSTFASTYPDSNWRAASAADLLLSGKASVEEIFQPGKATSAVLDKQWQHAFQRALNDSIPFLSSKKASDSTPGGVLLNTPVSLSSFQPTDRDVQGYLCVSLKAISDAAAKELQTGRLSEPVAWLAGMNWIDAIAPDPEHRDMVIIGRTLTSWPAIHLDDVAALLRNLHQPAPYCSLDPQPERILVLNRLFEWLTDKNVAANLDSVLWQVRNTLGNQVVALGNLPPCWAAQCIVMADYDMKRLSQGLVKFPGLPSMLERGAASGQAKAGTASGTVVGDQMARFWFCIGDRQPVFGTNAAGVIWLEECKVTVKTERQIADRSGALSDAHSGRDESAEGFARDLSNQLHAVGSEFHSIGGLENIFRLEAVLQAVAFMDIGGEVDLDYLEHRYPLQGPMELPAALPGLANGKVIHLPTTQRRGRAVTAILTPIVCGGVNLEVPVTPASLKRAKPEQTALCKQALMSRPNTTTPFWPIHRAQ